jgi:hypothetical protein
MSELGWVMWGFPYIDFAMFALLAFIVGRAMR